MAGIATLMMNHHHVDNGYTNNLAPEDVEYILEYTTQDPQDSFEEIGYGVPDAGAAVMAVDYEFGGFRVIHSPDEPVSRVSEFIEDVDINFNQAYAPNALNLPPDGYNLGKYLVTSIYEIQLLPGESLVDLNNEHALNGIWPRHSGSYSAIELEEIGIYTYFDDTSNMAFSLDENGLLSVTTISYAYEVLFAYENEDLIGTFHPEIANVRTAFSVYLTKNPVVTSLTEQVSRNLSLSLFPNPTNGELNVLIDSKEVLSIEVIDLRGRIVKKLQGRVKFHLDGLDNGTYFIAVRSKDGFNFFSKPIHFIQD